MRPTQQAALEVVAGRVLTPAEVIAIDAPLLIRNDVAIAELLSVGRTRLYPRLVGVGTIIEVMGQVGLSGGAFLDALVTLGTTNRDVYWAMVLIQNSNLDIGKAATQYQMTQLEAVLPAFATGLVALRALAQGPDPLDFNLVSRALNDEAGLVTI